MFHREGCLALVLLMLGTSLIVDASRVAESHDLWATQQTGHAHPSSTVLAVNQSTSATIPEGLAQLPISDEGVSRRYCHGFDCPKYTVINNMGNIELRSYEASTWVRTNVSGTHSFEEATVIGESDLTRYFEGDNQAHRLMQHTIPILTLAYRDMPEDVNAVPVDSELDSGEIFGVASYLSASNQVLPTQPIGKHMDTTSLPEGLKMWVHTFPGFASADVIRSELRYMLDTLHQDKLDDNIYKSKFFVAQYDPPTTTLDRHNEIWVLA